MNIIQTEYKGEDASEDFSDYQIDSSSHAPSDITQAEPKQKEKKRAGWKKPKTPKKDSPAKNFADNIDNSEQSDSDDDMDRNPNASPIIMSGKNKNGAFGYKNNTPSRFKPKMSEVVEETEPESSFKETNKFKKRKASASPMPTIDEHQRASPDFVVPEDREDDFSDSDEGNPDEKQAKNPFKEFTFIPGANPVDDNLGSSFSGAGAQN